jgi:hypothetical protein
MVQSRDLAWARAIPQDLILVCERLHAMWRYSAIPQGHINIDDEFAPLASQQGREVRRDGFGWWR